MTVEIVKDQIIKFLKSDTPEVFTMKGAWGVGKTYTWKKFLDEAKTNNAIALKKYSYVSLFGINSLDAFKNAIFENVVDKNIIGQEPSLDTFTQNISGVTKVFGRKSLGFLSEIPFLRNFSNTIESLSYLSLSKTLICIDDLERKGAGLSIRDALGLISQLKEQKKCKVVLLLNDGEDGLEDYVKYREKVIDFEIEFAPTVAECISIAFDYENDVYLTLRELTEKLQIRNIRILKKIERLINIAMPYTVGYEEEIKIQFISSMTLFAWCHFTHGQGNPTLEFVTKLGYSYYGIGDQENDSDEHKRWKALLQTYGYQHTDELDLVLAEAVRNGYFQEEKLKHEITIKNAQVLASKSDSSFTEAWKLYHDTFANNEKEVIDTVYKSFKENAKYITPTNLNGTVRLFRELGEQEKATELIDFYINLRIDEIDLFDLENNHFFGDKCDEEIIEKFKVTFSKLVRKESAIEVLERISGRNSWNIKDEVILVNTEVDEYYQIFKSETGPQLSEYVRTCLKFDEFSNPTEQQKLIANKARAALLMIAKESEINRQRVRKFGIVLGER